jgi:RNA polymerase sigma-70 factor (ECF subfamily)
MLCGRFCMPPPLLLVTVARGFPVSWAACSPFRSAPTKEFEMEDNFMTTINLKRYYPYMTENMTMEVSDEIAAVLSMGGRLCDSYKRQKRRNGECSLDTDPGFEADVLHGPMTPDEYMEKQERDLALYDALAQLPPVQARRIYQHYILGKSKAEIAAAEGVGKSRVCCSIERGLASLKNILKNSL